MRIELVESGGLVALAQCPEGPFLFKGIVGFKSEYSENSGFIHAFNEGGEYFWADAKSVPEQRQILVQPLKLAKVPVPNLLEALKTVHEALMQNASALDGKLLNLVPLVIDPAIRSAEGRA